MNNITRLSTLIIQSLSRTGEGVVTAESCTGGLIVGALTEIEGASVVIDRGFVTYSNAAKQTLLGVREESLMTAGAVSEIVAKEMAEGALNICTSANYSIAVTGIAGPGGGTAGKPVGLVFIAIGCRSAGTRVTEHHFGGDRASVRQQSVEAALSALYQRLEIKGLDR